VVSWQGNMDIFWRGNDGHLYNAAYRPGYFRIAWDLGAPPSAPLMSAPTPVFWGTGMDVYAVGAGHIGWSPTLDE
jgi:hypothetical protein